MYYDEEGALYVTDSSGNTDMGPVQLENPSHRILRLVDSDGDGVFDQSTVFAENVPFPEGLLVHKGSQKVRSQKDDMGGLSERGAKKQCHSLNIDISDSVSLSLLHVEKTAL
jgi:hypothetical protein